MPKAKGGRADDALKITDENERILELWFISSVSEELVEGDKPSNYFFVVNVDGQEERKLLSTALEYENSFSASVDVCFFRQKLMFALPDVDRILNGRHSVTLYRRSLTDTGGDALPASRASSSSPRRERSRRGNDDAATISIDGAVRLLHAPLDFMDLITGTSSRQLVSLSDGIGLRDVSVVARVGRELFPPDRLRRYRPMCVELRSLCAPALCADVRFGARAFVTPPLPAAPAGTAVHRHVFFLGPAAPLSVWRDFLLEPLRLAVLAGGRCVGAGAVSLRGAATDGQTHFSDAAALLPSRAAPLSRIERLVPAGEADVRVELFLPLPVPRHVLAGGEPAPRGAFLSRGVVLMPFAARWTPRALDAMIHALLRQPRAAPDGDVHACAAARPEVPDGTEEAEPPAAQNKQPAKSGRSKKKSLVVPPRPPTPPNAFDAPFDVVTPPGISGFEVMDEDTRVVCVEGPVAAVHEVLSCVAAAAGHDPRLKVLMNAELFIPYRAYLSFPPLVTPPVIVADVKEKEVVEKPISEKKSADKKKTDKKKSRSKSLEKPPPPPPPVVDTFDSAEAEASATGGRMHRIRLRETIAALIVQQRHLVRRALSDECVRCYTKLHALCACTSLREIFERDLFPTPAELIALERAFGLTLELTDVFGREAFVTTTAPVPAHAGGGAAGELDDSTSACGDAVSLAALRPADAGRIVGFDAVRLERRRMPASVAGRYPHVWWMRLCGEPAADILCAFPAAAQPGATIRYRIEAQVVRCAGTLCLYALSCASLAKSHVDSRNTAYEARRLAARRRGQRVEYECGDDSLREGGTAPRELPALANPAESLALRSRSTLYKKSRRSDDDLAAEYELCWELYNQRAPRVQPQPPRGPPMHF